LLLILYLFYNIDLVEQNITLKEDALGFVDDYSAWVIGNSAAENTRRLQTTVIPAALN
jgi:hypothetical protein